MGWDEVLLVRDKWVGLSGNPRLVLYALASRKNPEDHHCWPSIEMLVEDTGMSRATVCRAIAELKEMGAIEVFRLTRNDVTEYTLHLDKHEECLAKSRPKSQVATSQVATSQDETSDSEVSNRPIPKSQPETSTPLKESRKKTIMSVDDASSPERPTGPKGFREEEWKKIPVKDRQTAIDALEFYYGFPRQEDRKSTVASYIKARKKVDKETLLEARDRYAAFCREKGTEEHYIKHPFRWLDKERWEDSTPSAGPVAPFIPSTPEREARDRAESFLGLFLDSYGVDARAEVDKVEKFILWVGMDASEKIWALEVTLPFSELNGSKSVDALLDLMRQAMKRHPKAGAKTA